MKGDSRLVVGTAVSETPAGTLALVGVSVGRGQGPVGQTHLCQTTVRCETLGELCLFRRRAFVVNKQLKVAEWARRQEASGCDSDSDSGESCQLDQICAAYQAVTSGMQMEHTCSCVVGE